MRCRKRGLAAAFSVAETATAQGRQNHRRITMLLAPFTLSAVSARRCGHGRAAAPRVPAWLLAWAVGGFLAMLLFPALRGGDMAGMSVPFWLLGAPL